METTTPTKLYNSLVEMCVVVGMDQDTGLSPVPCKEKIKISGVDDSPLYISHFQPFVLAALSGETALFMYSTSDVDGAPFYPAGSVSVGTPNKHNKGSKKPRRVSLSPGAGGVRFPIASEVISSLPPLCLPDGGQVFKAPQESTVHYLVLTDIEGTRTYCGCLKIYKPFMAKENDYIPGQYDLVYSDPGCDEEASSHSDYQICYVPLCCCLISKYPYFGIFKDCLSSMVSNLKVEPRMFRSGLLQFMSQIAMVPIPPPGSLAIEFNFSGISHLVRPVDEPEKKIVDIELHYLFLCFSIDKILELISCVLTQQKLVFVSSKYVMLTLIIESIFAFIQPLSWSWTYVPVLPNNLVDMIEAPGIYILGCHISLTSQIERARSNDEMADIIIANIDDGTVTKGGNVDVPLIPARAADPFKARMKGVSPLFDLEIVQQPACLNRQEFKEARDKLAMEFNNVVLTASLEMMARMLSGMSEFQETYKEEHYFDQAAFIKSKPEEDQEFYRTLCSTHAFASFLEERSNHLERRDYFTAMMEKVKPQSNRAGVLQLRKRSSSINQAVTTSASTTSFDQPMDSAPLSSFTLPPFSFEGIFKGTFYDACIEELTTAIESLDNKSSCLMGNYLYLRGMLKVARGNKIDGLDDLFALSMRNMQLFPKDFIGQLLSKLTEAEKAEIYTKSFFPEASRLRTKETGYLIRDRVRVMTSAVPSSALDHTEFFKHVAMLQITNSSETAKKLFDILKNRINGLVDPDVFSNFHRSLQETDRVAQSIKMTGIAPEPFEFVVLVSSWLRTATSNGRLIATTSRLVFMDEGTHKCESVMRFKDILDVEYYQHYVVIPPGCPSLKITCRNRNIAPFIVCLKDDRTFWLECIKEMMAGYRIAEESRDHQSIEQASQNVIIADALRGSEQVDSITNVLCLKSENRTIELSKETKKMLVRRIDATPQANEAEKTTIEAMCFAPENTEDGSEAEVWCGLGSGAVVVIDTISWNIVTVLRYARGRVSCLESVGKTHIWVGSMDATIYIINRKTKQADQQLHSHHDYISHIIKTKQEDGTLIVWSASLEGLIIGWDPVTLNPKKTIKLNGVRTMTSIIAIGNSFWCVTRSAVLVVDRDSDGSQYESLTSTTEKNVSRSIDCICAITDGNKVQEVWTSCDKKGTIAIWDTTSHKHRVETIQTIGDVGFTKMLYVDGKVWGGSRDGPIYVINAKTLGIEQTLELHSDRVRSMCLTDTSFILTGPGSSDGRLAVWRTHLMDIADSADGFEVVEKNIVKCNS